MVKKIVNYILKTIMIISIVLCLNILYSKYIKKDEPVELFGISLLKVSSGSMSPTLKVNELILLKKSDNYKEGNIITYKTNDNVLITHRISKINGDQIITKGDANNTNDTPINKDQIVGTYLTNLPIISKINNCIHSIIFLIVFMTIIATIILIMIYNNKLYNRRLIYIGVNTLVIGILLLSINIVDTYSKFNTKIENSTSIKTANMVIEARGNLSQDKILIGSNIEQTFSVENFKGNNITNVAFDYYIYVLDKNNNNLTNIKLYKKSSSIKDKYNEVPIQNSGKYKNSFKGEFFLTKATHDYKLVVENIQTTDIKIKVSAVQKKVS